jgi:hypothetical protein
LNENEEINSQNVIDEDREINEDIEQNIAKNI